MLGSILNTERFIVFTLDWLIEPNLRAKISYGIVGINKFFGIVSAGWVVSFAAAFWAVTQRSERCVTAQKAAAKETTGWANATHFWCLLISSKQG